MKTATLTLLSMVLAFEFVLSLIGIPLVAFIFIAFVALWLTPKEICVYVVASLLASIPDFVKLFTFGDALPIDNLNIMGNATFWGILIFIAFIFIGRSIIQRVWHIKERVGTVIND